MELKNRIIKYHLRNAVMIEYKNLKNGEYTINTRCGLNSRMDKNMDNLLNKLSLDVIRYNFQIDINQRENYIEIDIIDSNDIKIKEYLIIVKD